MRRVLAVGALLSLLLFATLGFVALARAADAPTEVVDVAARQFAYSPGVIRLRQGATVHLVLAAEDVTHGFLLEGYGASLTAMPGKPVTLDFVASRPGRYRFYCNRVCGQLHPFMVGELIVEPNYPLYLGLGFLPLAAAFGLAGAWRTRPRSSRMTSGQAEVTASKWVRTLLLSRTLQQGVIALLLGALTLLALAGLFGSPLGSHNAAIIFVWIVWWGILKLVLIPFGGRAWCAVCPLPAPGEWLQRRAIASRGPLKALSLDLPWPRRLRGGWLAAIALLLIGVGSAPILTKPALTGWFLVAMAALAVALALVFRGRAFCRYVCPVGSFVGLYSLAAPLSVRVKDAEVCLHHVEKECLRGSATAYGCPWFAYPGTLTRNVDCGLCLECLRACPKGNVGLYLGPLGGSLASDDSDRRWPRLDEGFGAVVMLALAAIYTAIFLGPWGGLKQEALLQTPQDALRHALLIVGGAGLVAPLLWLGLAAVARLASGRRDVPLKAVLAGSAQALDPPRTPRLGRLHSDLRPRLGHLRRLDARRPARLGLEALRARGLLGSAAPRSPPLAAARVLATRPHLGVSGRATRVTAPLRRGKSRGNRPRPRAGTDHWRADVAGVGLDFSPRDGDQAPGDEASGQSGKHPRALDLAILVGVLALVVGGIVGARLYQGPLAAEQGTIDLVGTVPVVGGGGWSVRETHVKQGETVTLRLSSEDVTHGFLIPDLGIEAQPIAPGTYQTITFRADRPGVYTYYCNVLCSHRHGAMIGKLVVDPSSASA